MTFEKNIFNQAVCPYCGSWLFAIYLDEFLKPTHKVKCGRCRRFFDIREGIKIKTSDVIKQPIKNKEVKK